MEDRKILALTFAGGGNRAFYQLGLMTRWWERVGPQVGMIVACSAGASVVVSLLSGRWEPQYRYWLQRRAHVRRNVEWHRLLLGRRPAPHAPIYRDTILFALREGGFERIRALPFPILVLTAALPRAVPLPLAVPLGMGAYSLERRRHPHRLHPEWGKRLGFTPVLGDMRECRSPEELADLVIASSATPPFTPVGRFRGQWLLDGGMVDNAPAFVADSAPGIERHLVLLTRAYPPGVAGLKGRKWYLEPSEPPPVHRWDYTRPDLVEATIALGERDAERYAPLLECFLAEG